MDLYGLYYVGDDFSDLHAISVDVKILNRLKDENVTSDIEKYVIKKVKMTRAVTYLHSYDCSTGEGREKREKNAEFLRGKKPYKFTIHKTHYVKDGDGDINDLLIDFDGTLNQEACDLFLHQSLKLIIEDKREETKFEYFLGICKNYSDNKDEFPYYTIKVIVELCPISKYIIYKHGVNSMYTACYSDLFKMNGRYEDISDFSKVLNTNGIYCYCDNMLENKLLIFAMNDPEVTREQIINEYYPKFKNNNISSNPINLNVFYPEGMINA